VRRFRFRLERVLRIRRTEERLARAALKSAGARVETARAALEAEEASGRAAIARLASLVARIPSTLMLLRPAESEIEWFARRAGERRLELADRTAELERATAEYRAARAAVEALRSLRARRRTEHDAASALEERKSMDEAAILRHLAGIARAETGSRADAAPSGPADTHSEEKEDGRR